MTIHEASILLSVEPSEDIQEAIESRIFEAKQELIQKADQILLFPSKEKKFKLWQEASLVLGYSFPVDPEISVEQLHTETIEAAFESFHKQRSFLLGHLNQVQSFNGFVHILEAMRLNYKQWIVFWERATAPFETKEVKLSNIIDAMLLLKWILSMKQRGITTLSALEKEDVPDEVQHEWMRLKILHEKLS